MCLKLNKRTIKASQPSEGQKFLWNMIGSGVYSASAMLLSLFVINLVGPDEGGIFSIALTIGQMALNIAYFEMRTFQVTDAKDEFQFSEYHAAKVVVCIVMLVVSLFYVVFQGYSFDKSMIILLVCFARFLDGYADVYEAQFQKDNRLDLAGKSLAYRTVLYVFTLLLCLAVTKNLILSLVIVDVMAIVGVMLFDVYIMGIFRQITCVWNASKIKEIIIDCLPLFIGVFCWTYILSASRIAIDGCMSSEYQAYYQIIFMPISVISLFSSFIIKPMLPRMSSDYSLGRYADFKKFFLKGIFGIVIFTCICMIGAYFWGIPVLSLLSGCDLSEYRGVLTFLIFAGGFNAITFNMYNVLTIMRNTKSILIGYIFCAILAYIISPFLAQRYGINGAAMSYFIVVIVLCLAFGASILKEIAKNRGDKRLAE